MEDKSNYETAFAEKKKRTLNKYTYTIFTFKTVFSKLGSLIIKFRLNKFTHFV